MRAAGCRHRARADRRRAASPRAPCAGAGSSAGRAPTTRSARSTSGRMSACTRPWRHSLIEPLGYQRPRPDLTSCDSSHDRNSVRTRVPGRHARPADVAQRPSADALVLAPGINPARAERRLERDSATRSVSPGSTGLRTRDRQQAIERQRLVRLQIRDATSHRPTAPRRSRLSRARSRARRSAGSSAVAAHTSSSSCSSSRSTSPSQMNGIACTPKVPFSRCSW